MHIQIAFRILGSLLMIFSLTMLPPVLVSWLFADGVSIIFIDTFVLTFSAGAVLFGLFRKHHQEMRTKDGFLITFLFYMALGCFGAIPMVQESGINLSWADALFESFSGLTTTGATVITGIDDLPASILFYRPHRSLCRRLLDCGHVFVRCNLPQFFDYRHRWFLNPRCEHRLLRLSGN